MGSILPNLIAQTEPVPVQDLADLPPLAHAPIALALIAGFLLWIVGGRLIKPAFAAMGIVLGGLGGFLLLPQISGEQVLEMPSPYAGLIFGGLSGLILSIVIFRTAVGIAAAGAFSLVGLLGGLAFLQVQPMIEDSAETPLEVEVDERANALATDSSTFLDGLRDTLDQSTIEHAEQIREDILTTGQGSFESLDGDTQTVMRSAYEQARGFFSALITQGRERWNATGVDERMILMGAAILGAAGGLLIGFVAPKRSSAVVSALCGSAIWLASAVWLMHAFEAPGREFMQRSPLVWVLVWLGVALLGVVLQMKSRRAKIVDE